VNLKACIASSIAMTCLLPFGVWAAPSPRTNWLRDNVQVIQPTFKTRSRRKRSPFGVNANTLTSTAMRALGGGDVDYSTMINFAANRLTSQSGRSSNSLLSPNLLLRIFSAVSNWGCWGFCSVNSASPKF